MSKVKYREVAFVCTVSASESGFKGSNLGSCPLCHGVHLFLIYTVILLVQVLPLQGGCTYLPWDHWSNTNRSYLKTHLLSFIYNLAWWVDESESVKLWRVSTGHPTFLRLQKPINTPQLPPLLLYRLDQSQSSLAVKDQHFLLTYCISSWCGQLLESQRSGHM